MILLSSPHRRRSQAGYVLSIETLLMAVVLICGLITGWAKLRDQALSEQKDAIEAIDTYLTNAPITTYKPYAQMWIIGGGVVKSDDVLPVTETYVGPCGEVAVGDPACVPSPAGPFATSPMTLTYQPATAELP